MRRKLIMRDKAKFKFFSIFLFGAVGAILPLLTTDPYHLYIFSQIYIWGTASVALLINIRTGIFNLGHAAFMAIGAYTTALLTIKHGASFWVSLPIGAGLAVSLALLVGVPILRIKGMYFVLVTCALCEVMKLTIANFPGYTGGYNGLRNIPRPTLFVLNFSNHVLYYYLLLIFLVVSILILHRIWVSYLGKIFQGINEEEILCRSVGIPTTKYKILSFAISAFFASVSGSFLASLSSTIDPLMFGFGASINCFLYMVLGGVGSIFGPLIGSAVAIFVSEVFRFMLELTPAILGVVIILVMVFMPEGLINIPKTLSGLLRSLMYRGFVAIEGSEESDT